MPSTISQSLRRATAPVRQSPPVRAGLRHLRRWRVAGRSQFDNVYHCCTQKTASQWVKAVLRDPIVFSASGLTVVPYVDLGLRYAKVQKYPTHTIATHLYVSYDTYSEIPKPASYRTFFVLRDPRDVVVSWYFSAKYSHRMVEPIPAMRRDLQPLSEDDGYKYVIDRLVEWESFEAQRSWVTAEDPNVRIFRYEELAEDNADFIARLLSYLEIGITAEDMATLTSRHRFEGRAEGRPQGEEDVNSHYRKGVAGDWKQRLSPAVLRYFEDRTGDLISFLGYQEHV